MLAVDGDGFCHFRALGGKIVQRPFLADRQRHVLSRSWRWTSSAYLVAISPARLTDICWPRSRGNARPADENSRFAYENARFASRPFRSIPVVFIPVFPPPSPASTVVAKMQLILCILTVLLSTVRAYRWDPDWLDYNLNENQYATVPTDYWGEWTGHQYHPSPKSWRFPFYTLFLDRL